MSPSRPELATDPQRIWDDPSRVRLGWVGLGQIGAPMATHLAAWPGGLTVFDVREEAMAPLVEAGATAAASVADLGAAADLVSVMVLDDAQVRDVVGELLTSMGEGSTIAIHSTIRAETAEDLAAEAAPRGIAVVDAPVSGGFMGAHEGRLAVMIGGERDAYERLKEPFGCFAEVIVHVGPAGAGTRAEARPQPHHLRRLHRRGRGAAPGGGGGHRPAQARPRRAPQRQDHRGPRGDHDPRHDRTAPARRRLLRHARAHARTGEKDLALALELGDALDVDLPLARIALDRFGDRTRPRKGLMTNDPDKRALGLETMARSTAGT